jgi:hypothetical protein
MPFDRAGFLGRTGRRLPGLVFVAFASLHFATAWVGGPARNWHGQTSDYYPLLADAFRAGQTSLLVQPSPEMLALPDPYDPVANGPYRLHDASLYHGKYYLYFGPTPAIVLFLPYKVLTGSHLPTRMGVALFCTLGFACSCLLLFLLAKRENWRLPPWLGCTAVLSMGAVPGVSFLLIRPSFYEVAISAGYGFAMAGFLLAAHALGDDPPRTSPLVGAGFCFGLAAGCRPDLSLLAILMVVLVAFRFRSHKWHVLAFLAPIVLGGALLAIYNYVRFQNPLEFGIRYALLDHRTDLNDHFGHTLANFLPSTYLLAVSPAVLSLAPTMGLLWGAPISLLGTCAPCFLLYRRLKDTVKPGLTRFTAFCVYVSATGIFILLALAGFVLGRYTVDFAPEFVLLSWFVVVAIWQAVKRQPRAWQIPFGFAVLAATLYSAVVDLSICATRVPR